MASVATDSVGFIGNLGPSDRYRNRPLLGPAIRPGTAFFTISLAALMMFMTPSARAWSSKNYPLFDPVHQMAIDNVLGKLISNAADLKILEDQQTTVDQDQSTAGSYKHAMTGVDSNESPDQKRSSFIEQTEAFVRKNLQDATAFKKSGAEKNAFTALGQALHPIEDATSPAHQPFQPWNQNESWLAVAHHVAAERVYPAANTAYRSSLEGAVKWVYDIYTEQAPMPSRFFDDKGNLLLPKAY